MTTQRADVDVAQLEALADALIDSHEKLLSNLVAMRKRHRLTQDVVAERMGVSQPTVAAFERYDANPTLATIRRYALAVGASIQHVVEDDCCRYSEDRFAEVLTGKSGVGHWLVSQPLGWTWSSGTVVMNAYVDA